MMRRNCIRDLEAEIMKELCSDIRIEPELMPLDNNLMRNGNNAENARLDVSGIIWSLHPNAPSYVDKSIDQVYIAHEKEKKRAYNEQVIQMEKGTFTPIVILMSGGVGNKADSDITSESLP